MYCITPGTRHGHGVNVFRFGLASRRWVPGVGLRISAKKFGV